MINVDSFTSRKYFLPCEFVKNVDKRYLKLYLFTGVTLRDCNQMQDLNVLRSIMKRFQEMLMGVTGCRSLCSKEVTFYGNNRKYYSIPLYLKVSVV